MRIRVLENYGGTRTDSRRILPGEYDLNDPALFNCAGHLVEEGVAVVVEEAKPVKKSTEWLPATTPEEVAAEPVETVEEFVFVDGDKETEVIPEPVKPQKKRGK